MLFFDTGTYMLISTTDRPNICLEFVFNADIELNFIWDEC